MLDNSKILARLVKRLAKRYSLGEVDCRALSELPANMRQVSAGTYLVRDGDRPETCCVLLSGFAYRQKVTAQGGRQIIALQMAGEFVDLQNIFLDRSDHSVQALTAAEVAFIPAAALRDLAMSRPAVGRALWLDTLIDASIFREWVVNVGRRDSRSRVAHLLCEFALRLEAHGLAQGHSYELPMTQEQLADTVGLTPVHVNRVLRALEAEGLISRRKRTICIEDWQRMRDVGDFNERYLHHEATPAL